jgi:hypothetical protein
MAINSGLNEFVSGVTTSLRSLANFAPKPYVDTEGDSLLFYARDTQSYAKRLNATLTLFLATADDTLVGVEVKGISRILRRLKRLSDTCGVLCMDHKVKLGILIEFALVAPPEDPTLTEYEDDLAQFENVEISRGELEPAVS